MFKAATLFQLVPSSSLQLCTNKMTFGTIKWIFSSPIKAPAVRKRKLNNTRKLNVWQLACVWAGVRGNKLVSHILWDFLVTLHAISAKAWISLQGRWVKWMHFSCFSEQVGWGGGSTETLLPWWQTEPMRCLRHRLTSSSWLGLTLHGDCDGFTFSWFEGVIS